MSVVAIPKILRDKLTDAGADALVDLLDKVGTRSEEAMLDRAEDRFEKRLAEVKTEIISTLLKWMVTLWITQMFAIIALFFKR